MTAAPDKKATDLAESLRARIRRDGPIPLHEVMATVVDTYYNRDGVFGRTGDFTTAPEISQVFGELIGLWCAVAWQRMGRPARLRLIECGPGRGTLMADLLRATKRMPGFTAAADIHLVERSETLRAAQRKTLAHVDVTWHAEIGTVPAGPSVVIANEFVDALPIRQFVRGENGWHERCVSLDDDAFIFADVPVPEAPVPTSFADAAPGAIFEHNAAGAAWMTDIAQRIVTDGGAALVIDYGHEHAALGDTLQAVRQHRYHPVLSDLGTADITAHVDFEALAVAARASGAAVVGPVPQGTWLARLGLAVRVTQLTKGRTMQEAGEIANAAKRLSAPDGMGLLFKVMAIVHPDLANPALAPLDGFTQDAAP